MIGLQERDEKIMQLKHVIQQVQTVFDEKLQQIERAARENCARHQQPERRSWIVQRHEVEVDHNQILGRGSWGTVFKGWFRGAPVAVKELHRIIISDHNRILFHREMELASRLRHKNLVQFMAAIVEDGDPSIVTEFANYGTLARILQRRTLPFAEVLSIASDVGQGILYLHSVRPDPILHRDIKSENVLVYEVGLPMARIAKVSDFGSANFMRSIMTPNQGTPLYSAPETRTQEYTTKADVYSFGIVVLEMSIRELPVPQEHPRQLGKVVDDFLRQLIRECIQPNPDERPDMQRVVAELEQRKAEIAAMN
ncbi:putative serine/threonine-protein kinase drkA [Stylophora pistillata]|uniref:Putative serine/threonine-protein kinase drkA n=1 Tax=Stylophora pistillata TaxID=50429 RepID=A0A2B4R6Y3_STYPI|nr:putative serine/threonine-protein kinase drkA [Stylophora pistillata]